MRLITSFTFIITLALFASLDSGAAVVNPGDVIVIDLPEPFTYISPRIWRVDKETGDRTILCRSTDGTGPYFYRQLDWHRIDGDQSIVFGDEDALMRVDLATCNRTILSSPDLTSECSEAGSPFECCTGEGTGDGTEQCAANGSGPTWTRAVLLEVVPSQTASAVAALPAWGIALLVGVLLGLSIRLVRQQKVTESG